MSAAQSAMVSGIDSLVQAKLTAFTEARAALLQASLQQPSNPATIRTRAIPLSMRTMISPRKAL